MLELFANTGFTLSVLKNRLPIECSQLRIHWVFSNTWSIPSIPTNWSDTSCNPIEFKSIHITHNFSLEIINTTHNFSLEIIETPTSKSKYIFLFETAMNASGLSTFVWFWQWSLVSPIALFALKMVVGLPDCIVCISRTTYLWMSHRHLSDISDRTSLTFFEIMMSQRHLSQITDLTWMSPVPPRLLLQ